MHFEIDTARAKAIARAIAKRCKTHGAEIAYGQALDGLAAGLGETDWNTLSAKLKTDTPSAAGPSVPDLPGGDIPIPGAARSDDEARQATFDVRRYLAGRDDATLARILLDFLGVDFAHDYAIDHVVRHAADFPDQADAAAILDWCGDHDVGFEGEISGAHTLAWVRLFRPAAYAEAMRRARPSALETLRSFEAEFARGSEAVEIGPGWPAEAEVRADLARMRAAAGAPDGTELPARPEVPARQPQNTLIVYQYRDADNYKADTQAVLEGALDDAQIAAIKASLDDEEFFIPGQVGLPDLQDSFENCASHWDPEKDHPWHELLRLETTDAPANVQGLSAAKLAQRMQAVRWDAEYKPPFYPRMRQRYEERARPAEDARDPLVLRALKLLDQRRGPGPHPLQPQGRQMRGYRFKEPSGAARLFVLHEADSEKHLAAGHGDTRLGRMSWGEAESMLFAMADGWGLHPEEDRRTVPEAVAETLDDAPMAVARYLSSPPSFHTGALKMLVFVTETGRSLQARGYSFEAADGTVVAVGGAKLPDGIAFDGAVELRTSHTDWEAAEADLEAEMAAQGYQPYAD